MMQSSCRRTFLLGKQSSHLLHHQQQRRIRPQGLLLRQLLSTTTTTTTTKPPLVSWSLDETTKVGTITLESPATYNALTVEMGHEFSQAMRDIQHELSFGKKKDIHAMVLTSAAGTNAFSAGGNFEWLRSLRDDTPIHTNADAMLSFYQSFLCLRDLIPVPVIAALQGPAVGAGAGLALACDLRVAASSSSSGGGGASSSSSGANKNKNNTSSKQRMLLGFTFSRLGIHAGMGVSHLLPQCLGNRAGLVNELLLTGKGLSAQEAYDLGLVNRLVVDGDGDGDAVKEEAYKLAREVASQHPVSVRTMVQTLRGQQDVGLQAALLREAYAQATCYARNDWGAGLDAVEERRDPVFDSYHDK
eukprot:CAMPEP_0119010228 /NCGR_PEP_ID=MMETSP1176-20130426/4877_1 /TAXON_ID=265551 /ORGANISM="Synedropsis recta cf, Strain CCMP1620" /LENGTH=358 /DNA_ID=CAMNT_0006962855 /DNA_START=122 /DNA_END=1198 /DNA_ORIENTATION=-